MTPDPPYPTREDPNINYSVKELLFRIEDKLDKNIAAHDARLLALEKLPTPIANGELRMSHLEIEVNQHDLRISALEKEAQSNDGKTSYKRSMMAFSVGLASIVGVASAILINVLKAFV